MTAVHSSLARLLVAVGWNRAAISSLGIRSSGLMSILIASLFPSCVHSRSEGEPLSWLRAQQTGRSSQAFVPRRAGV